MMNVSFADCFSVSRRPMCCTIGSSIRGRGSVTLTCSPSAHTGSCRPLSAATSFAHAPAALTTRWAAIAPAAVRHPEAAGARPSAPRPRDRRVRAEAAPRSIARWANSGAASSGLAWPSRAQ